MELVEITKDNKVIVKLLGACQTCSVSTVTMKAGLEENLKILAPEIIAVEAFKTNLKFKLYSDRWKYCARNVFYIFKLISGWIIRV